MDKIFQLIKLEEQWQWETLKMRSSAKLYTTNEKNRQDI